jgi:hypothetical protein
MLRSVDFSNNSLSGSVPEQYGSIPELTALNLDHNPGLATNCPRVDLDQVSDCLPPFLTTDPTITQAFSDGSMCSSIVPRNPHHSISIDQQLYLRGGQCFCNTTSFQAPVNRTAISLPPVCVSCEPLNWCLCGPTDVAMRNCWADLQNTSDPLNRTAWRALECPYIYSPNSSACEVRLQDNCTDTAAGSCQCIPGYFGRRCSQCGDGYFSSSRSCEACASSLHVLLPIAWSVMLVLYMLYLRKVPGTASGALKVTLFYVQSLLLLVDNARIPWPDIVHRILHTSSQAGSLSPTALECAFDGITLPQRMSVYAMTPIGLMLICVVIYLIGRCARAHDSSDVLVYMLLSVLMTTYFSITLKALAGVSCTLSDGYLNAYPWVQCSTNDPVFPFLSGVSIISLAVYTFGVPILACVYLVLKKSRLDQPHVARQLGFLFGSYRSQAYLWEFAVIGRRLALAMALTMVPFTRPQLAAVVVILVLVVSIALQHSVLPFATVLENRLELGSLYSLLFAFLGVFTAEAAAAAGTPLRLLPVMVVVLVFATVLVLMATAALVLLLRIIPRLGRTALGQQLIGRSEMFARLTADAHELHEQLLVDEGKDESSPLL